MEKPIPSRQARISPSITSVLKVMSDEKALVLFNNVVVPNNNGIISLKEISLTSKQYHSRLSNFLKAGLIIRNKDKYIPTLLGKIVYDSQMVIEEALSLYWKLEVIDQVEMSSSDRPKGYMTQLINSLIDNHRIKNVLMKQADFTSGEAKSEEIF